MATKGVRLSLNFLVIFKSADRFLKLINSVFLFFNKPFSVTYSFGLNISFFNNYNT